MGCVMKWVRVYFRIYGRVQGVGFCWSMSWEVRKFGVYGWVRNLLDGMVEVVIEGDFERVEVLIGWVYQGLLLVRVIRVEVKWEEFEGLEGFKVVG